MSQDGKRYIFSGHAVGVAAQFDRLGKLKGLNHVVPALGAAVLPVTGGAAHAHECCYHYPVERPWKRSLLSVSHVESSAHGVERRGAFYTDVHSLVENLDVLEKLHIARVELNLSSVRKPSGPPVITTTGNKILGMRMGEVRVAVALDDDTLAQCGTKPQLAAYYAKKPESFRQKHAWRFGTESGAPALKDYNGYYHCTLVTGIKLSGPAKEVEKIPPPVGNMIYWPGFGRIFLGEVLVGNCDRRITMVRLAMGSDAGGSGSVGDGSTNGHTSM
jgi:hypothetical protein